MLQTSEQALLLLLLFSLSLLFSNLHTHTHILRLSSGRPSQRDQGGLGVTGWKASSLLALGGNSPAHDSADTI